MPPVKIQNQPLEKDAKYFATRILNIFQKNQFLSPEFLTRYEEINEELLKHLMASDNDCQQFLLDIYNIVKEKNTDPKLREWLIKKLIEKLEYHIRASYLNNPGILLVRSLYQLILDPSELFQEDKVPRSLFIVKMGADGKFVLQPIDSPLRSDSSQLTDSEMLASFENPQQLREAIQKGVVVLAELYSRKPTPPELDQAVAVSQGPPGIFIVDQSAMMIVDIGGNLISFQVTARTTYVDGRALVEVPQQMGLPPHNVVSDAQSSPYFRRADR